MGLGLEMATIFCSIVAGRMWDYDFPRLLLIHYIPRVLLGLWIMGSILSAIYLLLIAVTNYDSKCAFR